MYKCQLTVLNTDKTDIIERNKLNICAGSITTKSAQSVIFRTMKMIITVK